MDNPSPASSSDSTANTTFSPVSERTHNRAESPKYTYTTAGTIYNPKAAQSIRPPVRRHRAFKWPLDVTGPRSPSAELSFFPKSAFEPLPLRETPSPYAQANSDNTRTPIRPVYSPLQQIYDRAVTPPYAKKDIQTTCYRDMSAPLSQSECRNAPQPSPGLMLPAENGFAKSGQRDCAVDDDHDDDDDCNGDRLEHTLFRLSVKSLHNLASYPNPNQKKALKLLRTQRPFSHMRPETSLAPPNLASSDTAGRGKQPRSPVMPPPGGFQHLPPRGPKDHDKLPSSRAQYFYNHHRQVPGDPKGEAANLVSLHGDYKSTLATGPGAPQPLTAGPPGQRQYDASALEFAPHPLQSGSRPRLVASEADVAAIELGGPVNCDRDFEERPQSVAGARLSPAIHSAVSSGAAEPPPALTPIQLPATMSPLGELRTTSVPEVSSRLDMPDVGPLQSILHSIDTGDDLVDTKYPEEVRKYYPFGMPIMHEPSPVAHDWTAHYPLPERRQHAAGSFAAAGEELWNHNTKVYRQFHAGAGEFPGSMDVVIQQARDRRLRRSIGVIGDRRPSSTITRNDPLEVQQVNEMPLSEAAEPLLSMVFATLLNNLDYGSESNTYCPWQKPPRQAVDASCQGTFFGKSTGLAD